MSKQSREKSRRHRKHMGVLINDDFKKQMDSKVNWLSKDNLQKRYSNRHISSQDVTITECRPKSPDSKVKSIRYNFTMRNKTPELLGEFVDIAIFKNRIYFKPSTQRDGGFKMYSHHTGNKTNPFLQVTQNENTKALSDFVGDYDMQYDEIFEVYYIEKR